MPSTSLQCCYSCQFGVQIASSVGCPVLQPFRVCWMPRSEEENVAYPNPRDSDRESSCLITPSRIFTDKIQDFQLMPKRWDSKGRKYLEQDWDGCVWQTDPSNMMTLLHSVDSWLILTNKICTSHSVISLISPYRYESSHVQFLLVMNYHISKSTTWAGGVV